MGNIAKEIQEKQAERKLNILKGFSEFEETFEKAKTGKYADNSTNRKLNRVGQQYGNSKKEEEKSNDNSSKKEDGKSDPSGHYTKDERDALNKLEEHASSTSTEDLKTFLKKYGNDSTKMDEVEAARIELEDRGELEDDENNSEDFNHINEWIGDDYTSEHINSVIDALKEASLSDSDFKIKKTSGWNQDKFNDAVDDKVNEIKSEIRPQLLHEDLKNSDLENIIWGMVMSNYSGNQIIK